MRPWHRRGDAFPGRGFSLVELLVAMLLGVILSGAMVLAYIGARQNALYEEQMARLQENGRLAQRLLSRELVMAGFFAAVPVLEDIPPAAMGTDCSDDYWVLDTADPLGLANDHTGQPVPVTTGLIPLTCLDGEDIVPGTDVLAVKRTAGEASLQLGTAAPALTNSNVPNWYLYLNAGFPQGWTRKTPTELRKLVPAPAPDSYWRAITRIFYIRAFSDPGPQEDGIPTLCMESMVGDGMQTRCLVEGVEDVQFEFGVDTDADGAPNQYLVAPTAEQLRDTVTVQVHLLLRSIGKIPGWRDESTYALGRKEVAAPRDNYLRQVFSSTVFLRNLDKPLLTGGAS